MIAWTHRPIRAPEKRGLSNWRQGPWVLTFPYTMRFRLAADRHLLGTMLRVFLQVLFGCRALEGGQRGRGRALGIADGHTGSVSFIQRFGSALDLHVYVHVIVPEGLFVPASDDTSAPLRFVPLPPPTTAEVEELTRRVAGRLTARLTATSEEDDDYLDPDLAALMEALFWSRNAPPMTVEPAEPGLGDFVGLEVGPGRAREQPEIAPEIPASPTESILAGERWRGSRRT